MRKTGTIHFMLTLLLVGMLSVSAEAQRRRDNSAHQSDQHDRNDGNRNRDNDHRDHNNNRNKYSYDDRHDHYDGHDRNHYDRHDRNHHREVRHVHHMHKPVVVHHYHAGRPRYVYFRDYDVYYDCHRNTYISFSGRGWNVTNVAPFSMRNVNIRTARSYEVDYYDDDFPSYLQRRRPSCGQQYRGW